MAFQYGVGATHGILDLSSQQQVMIDSDHHELHNGRSYTAYVYDTDLDNAETLNICFKTPDTSSYVHVTKAVYNTVRSLFELLEAPTVTAGSGTDRDAVNRRRTSSNTSDILSMAGTPAAGKYTYNATITNDGTLLLGETVGGGSGPTSSSGVSRGMLEWVLKPNTIYAFRLTSLANDGNASIFLEWYAHPDRITPEGD
jgi:hypothetical protein